jgi:hypothetical protein
VPHVHQEHLAQRDREDGHRQALYRQPQFGGGAFLVAHDNPFVACPLVRADASRLARDINDRLQTLRRASPERGAS